MALLGTFIDSRTIATIATSGSATFAHGLGADPHLVIVQPEGTAAASSASVPMYAVAHDASNVTVFNCGQANQAGVAALRVVSLRFHSLIQ